MKYSSFEEIFRASVSESGERTALSMFRRDTWEKLTYRELDQSSLRIAQFLIAKGIGVGDRVALFSESQLECPVVALAALRCGAVLVPLDIKLVANELAGFLSHSAPKLIFCSSQQLSAFREVAKQLQHPLPHLLLNELPLPFSSHSFPDLRNVELPALDPDAAALIVYTSGTLGHSKGVLVSHRNLIFQMEACQWVLGIGQQEIFLSVLPMNHLFEFTCNLLSGFAVQAEICIVASLERQHLGRCLRERRPTHISAVPLMLSSLRATILGQAAAKGRVRYAAFRLSLVVSRLLPAGMRRSLFREIHDLVGGHLRRFISGGAPLARDVLDFYHRIGLPVFEGYGLSETGPTVTINTQEKVKLGSVGRALPGIEVEIDKPAGGHVGEILTRGPHVMLGYYKHDDLTEAAFTTDRWFKTGDTGYMDAEGFLYITGRLKRVIVLESGKKVHSEEVEAVFAKSRLIAELCVLGRPEKGRDSRYAHEEVTVVVVPSADLVASLHEDWDLIRAAVKKEIDELAHKYLTVYKRPTLIVVDSQALPKTSTLKVKVGLVAQRVAELLT